MASLGAAFQHSHYRNHVADGVATARMRRLEAHDGSRRIIIQVLTRSGKARGASPNVGRLVSRISLVF